LDTRRLCIRGAILMCVTTGSRGIWRIRYIKDRDEMINQVPTGAMAIDLAIVRVRSVRVFWGVCGRGRNFFLRKVNRAIT